MENADLPMEEARALLHDDRYSHKEQVAMSMGYELLWNLPNLTDEEHALERRACNNPEQVVENTAKHGPALLAVFRKYHLDLTSDGRIRDPDARPSHDYSARD